VLVVQHDDNDGEENRLYAERGNLLLVSDERPTARTCSGGRRQKHFFGKYSFEIVRASWRRSGARCHWSSRLRTRPASSPTRPRQRPRPHAGPAAGVVERTPTAELRLQREAVQAQYPPFVRRLQLVDLGGRLVPEDYFVLDDHLRASGHRKIAESLLEKLREPGR
jgi:hypothetical protein